MGVKKARPIIKSDLHVEVRYLSDSVKLAGCERYDSVDRA